MPPDQLTQPGASTTQRAVLAVLTGLPIADAARQHRLDPVTLNNAVAVYDQAGRKALTQHAHAAEWWQVYLHFTDWSHADTTFVTHVLPILRKAETLGAVDGWWYTRKHPCWRLRLRLRPTFQAGSTVSADLNRLVAEQHLQRWWPGIYEPESAAFGGDAGMTAAHTLFVTDSYQIQRLRSDDHLTVGPRELSVLLCSTMLRAAGLEWYEQGDVWHRVITDEHRSAIADVPTDQINALTQQIRHLLLADSSALFQPDGPLALAHEWAATFRSTGHTLSRAVQAGTLERGLRQVLSYHVIFHWNRLGLSMRSQSMLAWAARAAILQTQRQPSQ